MKKNLFLLFLPIVATLSSCSAPGQKASLMDFLDAIDTDSLFASKGFSFAVNRRFYDAAYTCIRFYDEGSLVNDSLTLLRKEQRTANGDPSFIDRNVRINYSLAPIAGGLFEETTQKTYVWAPSTGRSRESDSKTTEIREGSEKSSLFSSLVFDEEGKTLYDLFDSAGKMFANHLRSLTLAEVVDVEDESDFKIVSSGRSGDSVSNYSCDVSYSTTYSDEEIARYHLDENSFMINSFHLDFRLYSGRKFIGFIEKNISLKGKKIPGAIDTKSFEMIEVIYK